MSEPLELTQKIKTLFDLESSAHAPLVRVGLADVNLSQ